MYFLSTEWKIVLVCYKKNKKNKKQFFDSPNSFFSLSQRGKNVCGRFCPLFITQTQIMSDNDERHKKQNIFKDTKQKNFCEN